MALSPLRPVTSDYIDELEMARNRYAPTADIERGFASAFANMGAGYRANTAQELEAAGGEAFDSAIRDWKRQQGIAAAYAPRIGSLRGINGVGDAIDFAQGAFASGAASMAPSIGAALLTRSAAPLTAAIGALIPSYQLSRNEIIADQYSDPTIAATPLAERERAAMYGGAANAALESIVPSALANRFLRPGAGSYLANVGKSALEEAATETAQKGVEHLAAKHLNPNRELSGWDLADAAVQGALAGGGISAAMDAPGAIADNLGSIELSDRAFDAAKTGRQYVDSAMKRAKEVGKKFTSPVQATETNANTGVEDDVFGDTVEDTDLDILSRPRLSGSLQGATPEETMDNIDRDESGRVEAARRRAEEILKDPKTPKFVRDMVEGFEGDYSRPERQAALHSYSLGKKKVEQVGKAFEGLKSKLGDMLRDYDAPKQNLQDIPSTELRQLTEMVSAELGSTAAHNAPTIARQMVGLAVRLGDGEAELTPEVEQHLRSLVSTLGDDAVNEVSRIVGSPALRKVTDKLKRIPSAVADVQASKGKSFFETMLKDTGATYGERSRAAEIVDELSLMRDNGFDSFSPQIKNALISTFGSAERADSVLAYYGEMRRESFKERLGEDYDPETNTAALGATTEAGATEEDSYEGEGSTKRPRDHAEAQRAAATDAGYEIGETSERDGRNFSYAFRGAKEKIPFRTFGKKDGEGLTEGRRALKAMKMDYSHAEMVPYSEYLDEKGVTPEVGISKMLTSLDERIADAQKRERTEVANDLRGEKAQLEAAAKDMGPRRALNLYEVARVGERTQDPEHEVTDDDLRDMSNKEIPVRDKNGNVTHRVSKYPGSEIVFRTAGGKELKLSAVSIIANRSRVRQKSRRTVSPKIEDFQEILHGAIAGILARKEFVTADKDAKVGLITPLSDVDKIAKDTFAGAMSPASAVADALRKNIELEKKGEAKVLRLKPRDVEARLAERKHAREIKNQGWSTTLNRALPADRRADVREAVEAGDIPNSAPGRRAWIRDMLDHIAERLHGADGTITVERIGDQYRDMFANLVAAARDAYKDAKGAETEAHKAVSTDKAIAYHSRKNSLEAALAKDKAARIAADSAKIEMQDLEKALADVNSLVYEATRHFEDAEKSGYADRSEQKETGPINLSDESRKSGFSEIRDDQRGSHRSDIAAVAEANAAIADRRKRLRGTTESPEVAAIVEETKAAKAAGASPAVMSALKKKLDAQLDAEKRATASREAKSTIPQGAAPEPQTTTNVWFSSGENAILSNLAQRPFMFEGRTYFSVEHAYQTLKSGKFDEQTYSAYKKGVSRKITGKFKAKTEDDFNIKLMENLMRASFEQNPQAMEALKATGKSVLTHTQDTGMWKHAFPHILTKIRGDQPAKKAPAPATVPKVENSDAIIAGNPELLTVLDSIGLPKDAKWSEEATRERIYNILDDIPRDRLKEMVGQMREAYKAARAKAAKATGVAQKEAAQQAGRLRYIAEAAKVVLERHPGMTKTERVVSKKTKAAREKAAAEAAAKAKDEKAAVAHLNGLRKKLKHLTDMFDQANTDEDRGRLQAKIDAAKNRITEFVRVAREFSPIINAQVVAEFEAKNKAKKAEELRKKGNRVSVIGRRGKPIFGRVVSTFVVEGREFATVKVKSTAVDPDAGDVNDYDGFIVVDVKEGWAIPGAPASDGKKARAGIRELYEKHGAKKMADRITERAKIDRRHSQQETYQDGTVKTDTASERAIRAQIRRMLGKNTTVNFRIFGSDEGSGSYVRDEASQRHIIDIAKNAHDPAGVGWHEALHAFFRSLESNQTLRNVRRDMIAASSTPYVMAQLRKLLEGHPGAIGQIETDPEERAAYVFQLWAGGALELRDAQRNVFQKIWDFIREIIGVSTIDERIEELFNKLQDGQFSDMSIAGEVLRDFQNKTLTNKMEEMAPGLVDISRKLLTKVGPDRLRAYQIKSLDAIAEIFSSEEGKLGFIQRRFQESGKWMNRLSDIFEGTTATERRRAVDNLQKMLPPSTPLEHKIAKLLEDAHKYMKASGVKRLVTGADGKMTWQGIGYVNGYFPRNWDADSIRNHITEWKALLKKNGVADKAIDATTKAILGGNGRLELAEAEGHLGFTPFASSVMERQFKFITPANAADFAKFQQKDAMDILSGYVHQMVHRAEYASSFGNAGEDIAKAIKLAKLTKEEEVDVKNVIRGLEGTLDGGKMSVQTKRLMSTIMTGQNFILLPLALFSQMIDPIMIAARTGNLADAGRAYTMWLQGLFKKQPEYHKKMARMMGIISAESTLEAMGMTYGNAYMSAGARKANNALFRWNGMQYWNDTMRIAATAAGESYLLDHEDYTAGNKKVEATLKELGLELGDIVRMKGDRLAMTPEQFAEAGGYKVPTPTDIERAKRVQAAMFRFVDQAVLRPSASQRPTWMSDPRFMLLAHLKQFTFAMHNVILKRMVAESDKGNNRPTAIMMLTIPVMLASDLLKMATFTGFPQGWTTADYIKHAVMRSGLLGVYDFGANVIEDTGRGKMPGEGLLGPSVEHAMKILRWLFGDQRVSFGDVIDRTIPGARLID